MASHNNSLEILGEAPDVVSMHPTGYNVNHNVVRESSVHVCHPGTSASSSVPLSTPLNSAVVVKTKRNQELSPSKGIYI